MTLIQLTVDVSTHELETTLIELFQKSKNSTKYVLISLRRADISGRRCVVGLYRLLLALLL